MSFSGTYLISHLVASSHWRGNVLLSLRMGQHLRLITSSVLAKSGF